MTNANKESGSVENVGQKSSKERNKTAGQEKGQKDAFSININNLRSGKSDSEL